MCVCCTGGIVLDCHLGMLGAGWQNGGDVVLEVGGRGEEGVQVAAGGGRGRRVTGGIV